jgi:lipoprotein-anchoring transpeptidase ErfK/SrfK
MLRPVAALPLTLLVAALAVPAALAEDTRVIGYGVHTGGQDLGGLTVDQAAQRLRETVEPALMREVVVRVAGRRFAIPATRSVEKLDAQKSAVRAYRAGVAAGAPTTPPPADGSAPAPDVNAPLAVTHSRSAVAVFARNVNKHVARAPRDASVRFTVRHLYKRKARQGIAVDSAALAKAIDATLEDPAAPHLLSIKVTIVRAKINANDLVKRYPTVLTIDRTNFKLRLFKRLKISKTYGIAVGMAGLDTPAGLFSIHNKQVNPAWHVPRSPWAGSLQGQVIPGGAPNNPLKARWLGIANGVGIHGTAEEWSIGSRASHGCIRMRVADVIDLYPRVPVGTAVLIR